MKNSNTPATVYDNCYSDFITKLTEQGISRKRQSVLDSCHRLHYLDSELREVVIYYRVIDAPLNDQTDESADRYDVEQVTERGLKIEMDSIYESELLDHLNLLNPLELSL